MFKILKKFLLPGRTSACGFAAVGLKTAPSDDTCKINKAMDNASKEVKSTSPKLSSKMKPSELPIYSAYQPEIKETVQERSSLEEAIGSIRKELWVIYDSYKIYEKQLKNIFETGKAHTAESLHFLQEEATDVHRAGAIGVGGLAGIVFGLRGGFFRKLFYGSASGGGMAALCYPRESKEIADISLSYAKYYVTVGYNFIYGVKPEAFKFLPTPSAEDSKAAGSGPLLSSDKTVAGTETGDSSKVHEQISKDAPPEDTIKESNTQRTPSCPCSTETQDTISLNSENSKLDELGEMTSEESMLPSSVVAN